MLRDLKKLLFEDVTTLLRLLLSPAFALFFLVVESAIQGVFPTTCLLAEFSKMVSGPTGRLQARAAERLGGRRTFAVQDGKVGLAQT